jgi:TonB-linked SusC/RagA family outer membrane protein
MVLSLQRCLTAALAAFAALSPLLPTNAIAQEAMTITGRVTNENSEPLATVSVYIDGTDLATLTDTEGAYSLVIPASRIDQQRHVLIAGVIGFRSGQASVMLLGEDLTRDFQLELDPIGLEEIVAVGQGLTRERRRLGATVNSISDVDIELSAETNTVDAIAGKAPNVLVTRSAGDPASGTYINIRGFKTITGGNQPLFVVDGTPVDNSTKGLWGDNSSLIMVIQNRAADINPDDIASIEILKGPAGSAIYGSAGANGVILITTKSGSQTNAVQADVRFAYTADDVTEYNDLQTSFGQGFGGGAIVTSVTWGPELDPSTPVYDHGDELFRTGNAFDANATLSGGNNRTTYFFSGGYYRNNGVIRGTGKLDRFNIRLKASQGFLDNLTVSGNVAYTNQAGDIVQQGNSTSGILLGAFRTPPEFNNIPWIDPESGYQRSYRCETGVQGPNCRFDPNVSRGYDNPFWVANETELTQTVNRTFGNVRLDWDPFNWLNVSNVFGLDYWNDARFVMLPVSTSDVPEGWINRASLDNTILDNSLWITASGDLTAGVFAQLTLGQNIRQNDFTRLGTAGFNLIDGGLNLEATVDRFPDEYKSQVRSVGYFGELNFDVRDQLFVTGGLRYDGWNTFGGERQWFLFPNGSVAWEFTQLLGAETGILDFGKVRVAYGEAGQDPPAFSNVSGFITTARSSYLGQEGLVTELTAASSGIGPERTKEFEAGLDLAFVDSRVSLGVVWYDQKTEDAILELPVPPSLGFEAQPTNGAEFRNRGWEFQLGLIPFRGRGFTWEINAHGGTIDSEVLDLRGAEQFQLNGFTSTGAFVVKDICGPSGDQPCPFGVLYGEDMVKFGRGLSADVDCDPATPDSGIDEAFPDATPGALYVGCDGYPFADQRLRVLGDPNPDWNGGVRNTFTILENLRISALIDWRSGIDMWNGTKGALFFFGTHAGTEEWHGAGQPWVFEGDGPGAGQEVIRDDLWAVAGNGSGFTGGAQFFVERASFVKLRDLSIRYALGRGTVSRFLGFSRAEFSFTGRNLITWTDYTGLDPESNLPGQSTGRGLEYFNNPRVRSYVFQINLVR